MRISLKINTKVKSAATFSAAMIYRTRGLTKTTKVTTKTTAMEPRSPVAWNFKMIQYLSLHKVLRSTMCNNGVRTRNRAQRVAG